MKITYLPNGNSITMNELLQDVKQIFLDRIKNPFISTFFLSWIACNHNSIFKFIFIAETAKEKQILLENYSFSWMNDIFIPIGISAIYFFAIPYIGYLISKVQTKIIIKHKKLKFEELQAIYNAQISSEEAKEELNYVKDKVKIKHEREKTLLLQKQNDEEERSLHIKNEKAENAEVTYNGLPFEQFQKTYLNTEISNFSLRDKSDTPPSNYP